MRKPFKGNKDIELNLYLAKTIIPLLICDLSQQNELILVLGNGTNSGLLGQYIPNKKGGFCKGVEIAQVGSVINKATMSSFFFKY